MTGWRRPRRGRAAAGRQLAKATVDIGAELEPVAKSEREPIL